MGKVLHIIRKKPLMLLATSLSYICLTGLLKWRLNLPIEAIWYITGGLLGVYFLDFAEEFFHLTPSPFRTMVFAGLFTVVSLFIVSSSVSFVGRGLVLSVYLTMILRLVAEWRVCGNLDSWCRMVAGPVSAQAQRWLFAAFFLVFILATALFIL
ncbi:hypothetical protein KKB64_04285 [Patescibacteria group bacterium]|nr:hypothetical protein [Patescibacteria group bacterium]MBU1472974.1 hypothetical protein [Patescibacteria group bacterium]MBU2459678.1 hypothetical protein [Patescibacteria group bacterium]MBU2544590.1 hypothetical protein [Patescibacteria group bacterium]